MNKMGLLKLHITLQFVWTEGIFLNDKDSNKFLLGSNLHIQLKDYSNN